MNKNVACQWKSFTRNTRMVSLDVLLTMVLLLLFSPLLTGLALHELVGIFFFALVTLHLLFSWHWIAQSVKGVRKTNNRRRRLNFLLNGSLFILIVLQVVSGCSISQVTLPAMGIKTINDSSWLAVHNTCYQLIVVIICLHISLNLPRLLNYFKKHIYFTQTIKWNFSSLRHSIKKNIIRALIIILVATVIAAIAYYLIGLPNASRLNTVDQIHRFRQNTIPGLVQYTGAGIVVSILVYMAYRWVRMRL